MWIYDKAELARFIDSKEWRFQFSDYDIRAKSAVGWSGKGMHRYKGTVIPMRDLGRDGLEVVICCGIHHLANNYIGHHAFCKVPFPFRLERHYNDVRKEGIGSCR